MGWQPREARVGALLRRAGSRAGRGGQYYGMPERRGASVGEYYGMFLGVKVRGGGSIMGCYRREGWLLLWDAGPGSEWEVLRGG